MPKSKKRGGFIIQCKRYRTIRDVMERDGNDIIIIGGSLINSNRSLLLINSEKTQMESEISDKVKDA